MKYTLREYDQALFWNDKEEEMKVIQTMEGEPQIGANYEIGGQIYRVCAIHPQKKIAGLHLIQLQEEPEEETGEEFTCPYCGDVFHDAFELRDDEGETQCGNCGSELEYERDYTVTYTVTPKKKARVIEL